MAITKEPKPGYAGGKARARQLSPEELTAQALKATRARWAKEDLKWPPRVRRALRLLRAVEAAKKTDAERLRLAHVARKAREAALLPGVVPITHIIVQ